MHRSEVDLLMTALIKSGTQQPRRRSSVMPIAPFREMFVKWGPNNQLSVEQLRMKVITLLALLLMLRPSDIAPLSNEFDGNSMTTTRRLFTTRQIVFHEDMVEITFHGTKNDSDRAGFAVKLPAMDDALLDPVSALKDYLQRTEAQRQSAIDRDAVFLALNPSKGHHHALQAGSIGAIMDKAIALAGLGGLGFSAKSFRPTGGTHAIGIGIDPEVAMKIGRWKTRSVFFEHYVHSKPPSDYSKSLLACK